MCGQNDNRAVTALFRVFGGTAERCTAEACQHTTLCGMHAGECMALAVWVPLSVLVAVGDLLCRGLGLNTGLVLAIPIAFLMLNLLPYALGGKTPASRWWRWLGFFTIWALWVVWDRESSGVAKSFAWGWIALFVLNVVVCGLQWLGHFLAWNGTPGIAWRAFGLVALHLLIPVAAGLWGWPRAIAVGAVIAALFCWAILRPCCQWLGPVMCRTGERGILVTIDDGPDPHDTPVLLDLLDRHQVKAVFFMIGEKVAAYPELAREVLRRGHEIGNHTMTHPQASFWCAGPWRTRREIADCQRVIEDTGGVKPRWFRAPVGHRNLFTHPIAGALGLKVMAWNRRGFDAVEKDPAKVLARILPELGPGDIVLLHESTPIAAEVLGGVLAATPCDESANGLP